MRNAPKLTPETQTLLDGYKAWNEQNPAMSARTVFIYWSRIRKLLDFWENDPKCKGATLETVLDLHYTQSSRNSISTSLTNFQEFYSRLGKAIPGLQVFEDWSENRLMDPKKFIAMILANPNLLQTGGPKGIMTPLPVSVLWACWKLATKEWYIAGVDWHPKRGLTSVLATPIPLEVVPTLRWSQFQPSSRPGEMICVALGDSPGWEGRWHEAVIQYVRTILWAWAGVWKPGDPAPTLSENAIVLPIIPGNFTRAVNGKELRRQFQPYKAEQWTESYFPEFDFDPAERMKLAANQHGLKVMP
jgi:hypothetical protein